MYITDRAQQFVYRGFVHVSLCGSSLTRQICWSVPRVGVSPEYFILIQLSNVCLFQDYWFFIHIIFA